MKTPPERLPVRQNSGGVFSVLNHNADFANMEDHLDDQIAEMESDIAEQTEINSLDNTLLSYHNKVVILRIVKIRHLYHSSDTFVLHKRQYICNMSAF